MRCLVLVALPLCLPGCATHSAGTAGSAWDVVRIEPRASLRAVAAPLADVVWCSGSGGTVLRSVDGGRTFQRVGPRGQEALDFRSLAAVDGDRAWVASAGSPARVFRTEDGGAQWTLVHEDLREGAFFDALVFVDEQLGYLLGDPLGGQCQLYETDDGGRSFHLVGGLPRMQDGEAMFAASCGCLYANGDEIAFVTGGSCSRVFRSRDRGRTWSTSMLPLQQGRASQGAFAIAAVADGDFVAVGGDHAEPARTEGSATRTDGGGSYWRRDCDQPGYCSGVAVLADGRTAIAVGTGGSFCSRDGGRTWRSFSGAGFHAVAAVGARVVAVGSDGRIGTARP